MGNNKVQEDLLILVNPNAGNGKGKKEWNAISSVLNKYNLPFSARFSEKKGHATEITR
jgi:diacylglycerol kinase family enzyme